MKGKIIDLQMTTAPCSNVCCGSFYMRPPMRVELSGSFALDSDVNPAEFHETVALAIDSILSGKKVVSESERVKELETELYKVKAQEKHLRKAFKQWRSANTAAGMQFKELIKLME